MRKQTIGIVIVLPVGADITGKTHAVTGNTPDSIIMYDKINYGIIRKPGPGIIKKLKGGAKGANRDNPQQNKKGKKGKTDDFFIQIYFPNPLYKISIDPKNSQ